MSNPIKLNAIGQRCPDFLMLVRKTLRKMSNGDVVEITSDDDTSPREIPKLCLFLDHTLVESSIKSKPFKFIIKKGLNS